MLAGLAPPASAQEAEEQESTCVWDGIVQAYTDLFDPYLWPWQTPQNLELLMTPEEHAELGLRVGEPEGWEDGLRTSLTDPTFEWWYFDGHLDDGSTVVVVYYTKPQFAVPLLSESAPFVQIDITRPDGTAISKLEMIDPDDATFSTAGLDVALGNNIAKDVSGDLSEFHFTINLDDVSADLTLVRTTPAWRPGTGIIRYGDPADEYFGWLPSVPNGDLTGTLTYDGAEHTVSGSGYHDHNWGNANMAMLMKDWWWTRSQVEDYTIIAVDMHMKNKFGNNKHTPVFVVMNEDEVLIDQVAIAQESGLDQAMEMRLSQCRWHRDSDYFGFTPKRQTFTMEEENGDYAKVTYNSTALIASVDLLEGAGLTDVEKTLARIIGKKPWYSRWQSDVRLQFDIDGVRFDGNGIGTVELMELE